MEIGRFEINIHWPWNPIEEGMEVDLTREGYLLDQGPKPKTAKRKFGGF
jgi:hypothetical protein